MLGQDSGDLIKLGLPLLLNRLAERLFQGGAASALDRLDAERAMLAARQAVVQLQLAERQNALLLYRVLGGGALVP